jgi:hypothetical protein
MMVPPEPLLILARVITVRLAGDGHGICLVIGSELRGVAAAIQCAELVVLIVAIIA